MRRIIIDTDTASDDAVAIMMALAAPQVQVEALTIVAGNVGLAQASINARHTLKICNAHVPVYDGCSVPLLKPASTAEWFHGEDGMGNQNYPLPVQTTEPQHAVNALIERFRATPGEIELITLGPLTNIATALSMEPELANWVKRCTIMGGAAATLGNVTPAAEYNFWCDPEAARRVLHSGMPITLVGWELSCGEATLSDAEIDSILSLGNERASTAIECNRTALEAVRNLQGQTGLALADPVAMAVALDPTIAIEKSHHYVDVETVSELTRGMSVVDINEVTGNPPNTEVCFAIDNARWKALLLESLTD